MRHECCCSHQPSFPQFVELTHGNGEAEKKNHIIIIRIWVNQLYTSIRDKDGVLELNGIN